MLKKLLTQFLFSHPPLYLFVQLFRSRVGPVKGDLQSVHDAFRQGNGKKIALDLGCGLQPKNMFNADEILGIDLHANPEKKIFKARLGFERLPFDDGSFDYATAYDLLEHIPRYGDIPDQGNVPFIYLMNEIYRVMKSGGLFLSLTPVYPYLGAFQDPTHNNIMTVETLRMYFSNEKFDIANHYGIKCDFEILYEKLYGQHLLAIMQK